MHSQQNIKSIYYPTNVLRDTIHATYINSYMFWHQDYIFRDYYNKGIQANMPMYVLFILISIIKMFDC
jgi:hypothetical protein